MVVLETTLKVQKLIAQVTNYRTVSATGRIY